MKHELEDQTWAHNYGNFNINRMCAFKGGYYTFINKIRFKSTILLTHSLQMLIQLQANYNCHIAYLNLTSVKKISMFYKHIFNYQVHNKSI
jgi:hypothetical protein